VFSIFGAAVAAAKIMRFTDEQVHATISLCTNLAGSNLESRAPREGAAARNAMLAVSPPGRERSAEARRSRGPAGFYQAYAGDHRPLTYSFAGATDQPRQADGQARHGLDAARDATDLTRSPATTSHTWTSPRSCAKSTTSAYADVDRVEAVVNG
jgi:hypothetical protein